MTWKQKTVIRILLLVARMVSDESWVQDEIKHLHSHISAELFFSNSSKSEGAKPV